uniref:Lnb N-terminal periplasmic domain-containing protein n=1 Tax=uncultured Thiotrichaceae bacterium TaxID=298394 RepID=A0A6S6U6S3_9GAMM|nr:MAG: Unknown protein [uncultured Thiotrichaceae bacterium]
MSASGSITSNKLPPNTHNHEISGTSQHEAVRNFNISPFTPAPELQQTVNNLSQQSQNQINLSTDIQSIGVVGNKGSPPEAKEPENHVEVFIEDPSLSSVESWFGHAAIRIDDKLYEILPLGENKSALDVHDNVNYYAKREATGIQLNLTPDQVNTIKETMLSFKGDPYDTLSHNCTTAIVEAFEKSGIDFALPIITPMALENYLSGKNDIVIKSTEYPKTTNE